MNSPNLTNIEWPESWRLITPEEHEALAQELRREIGPRHPLWQKRIQIIARRVDNDDILVWIEDSDLPMAIVHLTWRGTMEADQNWPHTTLYANAHDALLMDMADTQHG